MNLKEHILYLADQFDKNIANTQLGLIIFEVLVKHSDRIDLYADTTEKCGVPVISRYGVRFEGLYEKYRIWGSTPILDNGRYHQDLSFTDETILELLNYDMFDLARRISDDEFWQDNERHIRYVISDVEVKMKDIREINRKRKKQ